MLIGDAIAAFLDSGEGDHWPQDGGLILRHAPDGMLLVHAGADEFSFIELEPAGAGWSFSGDLRHPTRGEKFFS